MHAVKDLRLAAQGNMNIELAEKRMGALLKIRELFTKKKPLKNIRIGMALHVTKETAVLVRTLIAGGARVTLTSCNPLSTQDDVAAALAKEGVEVYAYKGETKTDYYRFLKKVIASRPNLTIDDGCDLVTEIHTNFRDLIPNIIGGCEETTTGVLRLRAMVEDQALLYPMIAVNDNQTKHLMDNYYGTGQSTLDGILRASNIMFAGATVVVAGYGSCGKGVALRAQGMGAKVIVTEVNSFRALQAAMDGFSVLPMKEASQQGDMFITVTGNKHVIRSEHMKQMKTGAMLCNSGHFDVEIDVAGLEKLATKKRRVRPFMQEYTLPNKKIIYLLGEGRLINLAAAEGHPSEVMSLSFCGQALACQYLVEHQGRLENEVIDLPPEVDQYIAKLQLENMGIKTDQLTQEQKKYLRSWKEGT